MVDTVRTLSVLLTACANNTSGAITEQVIRDTLVSINQLFQLSTTTTYADDAAAAAGGVPVGQIYRNGSVVQVRVA